MKRANSGIDVDKATLAIHPIDIDPHAELPESEKFYDREMAMNTIKLLKKLGWELKKTKK